MNKKLWVICGICVVALAALAITKLPNIIDKRNAPKISPMRLFNITHNRDCLAILTDSTCFVKYTYIAEGSESTVREAVITNLSKNPYYSPVFIASDDSIAVYAASGKNAGKNLFDISFINPDNNGKSLDFVPTPECNNIKDECVEAVIMVF